MQNEWNSNHDVTCTRRRRENFSTLNFANDLSRRNDVGLTFHTLHGQEGRERERETPRGESGVESSCDTRYSVAAETQTSLSRGISRRVIHGGVNPNEFLLLLFSPPSLLSSFNPRERVKRSKEKATSRFIILFNFYFRRWLQIDVYFSGSEVGVGIFGDS